MSMLGTRSLYDERPSDVRDFPRPGGPQSAGNTRGVMMTDLVLTLIGPDRPGLVESVAARVAAHGGNWLESRMAHLAGQFAGILRVEVPAERLSELRAALLELEAQGLRIVAQGGAPPRAG